METIEIFNSDFFDNASKSWRINKKYLGKGYFAYRCKYLHSNGKQCSKSTEHSSSNKNFLKIFYSWNSEFPLSNSYCKQHKNRYKYI